MRVAFFASEATPFVKTGGLADVCGSLPKALDQLGITIDLFLPMYQEITIPDSNQLESIDESFDKLRLSDNLSVYFFKDPLFQNRSGIYGNKSGDFPDNCLRYYTFNQCSIQCLINQKIPVDIFHCHDWQTALIPVLYQEKFKQHFAKPLKTLLTIHNLAFQGVFAKDEFSILELDNRLMSPDYMEFYDKVNLLKSGIIFADKVSTVSPTYKNEIQTKEYGCGLEGVIQNFSKKLIGILNGLDLDYWNPQTDQFIPYNFSEQDLTSKQQMKEMLLGKLNLNFNPGRPLFGFVNRLSHQKGSDFIIEHIDTILQNDMNLILQGVGDQETEQTLKDLQEKYPQSLRTCLFFDESLAHQIYAASDFFLMPSRFEPCGLSQMIAMRYGTIPIVYQTGGLKDTVTEDCGFSFSNYSILDFNQAIQDALKLYQDSEQLVKMKRHVMTQDFSWEKSAKEYKEVYECLLSE